METGEIVTVEGNISPMVFNSISVHGDTPGAVEVVRTVRKVLSDTTYQSNP